MNLSSVRTDLKSYIITVDNKVVVEWYESYAMQLRVEVQYHPMCSLTLNLFGTVLYGNLYFLAYYRNEPLISDIIELDPSIIQRLKTLKNVSS